MAKKNEQMDLIDVQPENVKPIVRAARRYKQLQSERKAALDKEVAQKRKVLEMVNNAGLKRLENGVIRFTYDGVTISVTPRDELIKVEEDE